MTKIKICLIFTVLLFLPVHSFANCLNISGTYKVPNQNRYLKYRQADCQIVYSSNCQLTNGAMVCSNENEFILDGQPHRCRQDGCTIFSIDSEKISQTSTGQRAYLILDTSQNDGPDHGWCSWRERSVSLDSEGNILQRIPVIYCKDGFKGELIYRAARM